MCRKLVLARPGPIVLFALFGIVLFVALGIAGTIITCVTCCIAGAPLRQLRGDCFPPSSGCSPSSSCFCGNSDRNMTSGG